MLLSVYWYGEDEEWEELILGALPMAWVSPQSTFYTSQSGDTHSHQSIYLWDFVATNFATVCASVEYPCT